MAEQGRRPVIVGVDGSDSSVAALRQARELADALGCPLEAVAVWNYQMVPGTFTPVLWNPAEEAGKVLRDALVRAFGDRQPAGIEVRAIHGQPARALVDAGRGARMLVLGGRGRGGISGRLLGSVSAACSAHAPCPVLIVRAGPGQEPAPPAKDSKETAMNGPVREPEAADGAAQAALREHHGQMRHRLQSLAAALARAVAAGDSVAAHDEHAVLVEWCETDLLPHTLAEEDRLYGAAAGQPEGRLLVSGLLAEHQALVALLEELRGAGGTAAAVTAGALDRVFALHLDKEDQLLLPLLAGAPGFSLPDAVEGLEALVGAAHVRRSQAGEAAGR